MEEKIILFVIGVLLGAVIATGAFYVYTTTKSNCDCTNSSMNGGEPPEMPSGQSGTPPEKPSENNTENNTENNN